MMELLREMLSYPFIVRALTGGLLISLCASLLGVSLVLKRYSMIGDGLSHVSFGALSVAVAFGWAPLAVSIPVVAAAAVLLLRITGNGKIKSDAAIAHDLCRLLGCGDHRHIPDHGNDHRRQQLYVRQHPGHEPGGRGIERRPVPDRPGDVHSLLQ